MAKKSKKIPAKAKKLPHRVLRDGEHTGHKHAAVSEDVELYEHEGVMFARMPRGTRVVHEEHNPVLLPAGDKQIGATREYSHLEEEAREVAD